MNKVERVKAAINFMKVDRIPKGEFYFENGFIANLLKLKRDVMFEDKVEAYNRCGLDALAFTPAAFTANPPGGEAWQELNFWRKETDFFIFAIIDGPFQGTAKTFPSFTDYLLAIAHGDSIIPELVKQVVAANIDLGLSALALGAHGIIIADDIAYNGGMFISPTSLRTNFFPGLYEQIEAIKQQKVPVFFHADGNLKAVLNDLITSGVNGLHSLDFSSLDEIAFVRKATENKVCLMGGYDLGWFTEENRTERAWELLKVTALKGGYIFGSSAGILGEGQVPQSVLDVYQFVSSY